MPTRLIIIYNRWGQSVYTTNNYENDWKGEGQSSGVYFYKIESNCCGIVNGWVHVVSVD
jgi:hypothetical protein